MRAQFSMFCVPGIVSLSLVFFITRNSCTLDEQIIRFFEIAFHKDDPMGCFTVLL